MFKKFFTQIKDIFTRITTCKTYKVMTMVASISFAVVSGVFIHKYFKTFKLVNAYKSLLKDTQTAFAAVNGQCTQLTLDNTVLSEMLGMVLGVPGNIYE